MKISLFSQSLFALDLPGAIAATAEAGFAAIELACTEPHFDLQTARKEPGQIAAEIQQAGLLVSALSLFTSFTEPDSFDQQVEAAAAFVRLAPLFKTDVIKLTPGGPASADSSDQHWQRLARALERLIPVAEDSGVSLAVETHMRQLTDRLDSARRLLQMVPHKAVGLTVDFLNLAFAGEKAADVVALLRDRMYHTHVKNGYIDTDERWHFQALDRGLLDYAVVLKLLQDAHYSGYLSVECLGPPARTAPVETARRDLTILERCLTAARVKG